MNNLISIVEISITDFPKAVKFYQTVLGVTIQEMEMDGNQIGIIPNEEGSVNVALIKGRQRLKLNSPEIRLLTLVFPIVGLDN